MAKMKKRRAIDHDTTIALPISGTKVCPECGKRFDWYGEQWVYRNIRNGKKRWFCSYTCWRAEDHRKASRGEPVLRGERCRA